MYVVPRVSTSRFDLLLYFPRRSSLPFVPCRALPPSRVSPLSSSTSTSRFPARNVVSLSLLRGPATTTTTTSRFLRESRRRTYESREKNTLKIQFCRAIHWGESNVELSMRRRNNSIYRGRDLSRRVVKLH